MLRILFFVCLISVAGTSVLAADFYPQDKAVTYLQKVCKQKQIRVLAGYDLNEALEKGYRMVVYAFSPEADTTVNYAVFTESKGRYDLFDYLVITDAAGTVKQVHVLKYRSEHGGEIASRKWLAQFEHYSGGDLEYGRDIAAISGATLSAGSITRTIPEVVEVLQHQVIRVQH